jgi:hypothetical protein
MKKKTFDAVEMMHRGGAAVYEQVKGMTEEEEIKFWREIAKARRASQAAPRRKRKMA